ncbi:glycoside hydrolase family 3 C-terminal domain-containing protein [Ekhidna sp.]
MKKYSYIDTVQIFTLTLILGLTISCTTAERYTYDFENPELTALERSQSLVAEMTLSEKVSQMKYDAPAIPRLDVPQYNWWNECLHGVGRAGEATVFPQAIGMGATWDRELMMKIGEAISDEARAKHHRFISENKRGIYQGLTFWTPNINIFRDPRWGRGQETYGEDPFLTSRMAVNFINGLQGNDENYLKVVATAKHFAVHSGPEKSRHEDNYQTSNKDLYETYLPAFEATIKEANVQSIMCAYNRYRDEACCGSNLLLDSILRKNWKFKGYVVSDCWAINDFYIPERHGVSNSPEEASALAVKQGTDLNCGSTFDPNLSEAVLAEMIDEGEVDKALVRLMTARFKLGMFDDPSLVTYSKIPYDVVRSSKHAALSLKAARESIVLLKNDENMLPLSKDLQTIAVIGPNADTRQALLGNYHGTSTNNITPLMGIQNKLPNANILYEKGSYIADGWPLLTPIPNENLQSEGNTGLKGKYYANSNCGGEPSMERIDEEVNFTWVERPMAQVKSDTFSVRWEGQLIAPKSGEYRLGLRACNVGKMYLNGEQVIEFKDDHQPSMKYYDIILEKDKPIDIQIDYSNFHTDPQIQLLWAKLGEDLLSPALKAVKQSDVAILFLGLSPDIEGEEMPVVLEGFDKGDRSDIQLSKTQRQLLKAVVETGKPVIVVLMNGSALAVNYAAEKIPSIVEAWYPGEFGGNAIADILFGDYNPSGKLPVTYYKSVADLPDFKSYDMTNRTYKYFREEPLFPFGHGLSYTNFTYANLEIPSILENGNPLQVRVEVSNIGEVAGEEVIQVYSKYEELYDSPNQTLVAFQRVKLAPGETKKVIIEVREKELQIFNADGNPSSNPKKMIISVGGKQPGFSGIRDAKSTQVLMKEISIK